MKSLFWMTALALFAGASPASAQSLAADPLGTASFFPIAVWWQPPNLTGHSGPYATVAAAAAAAQVNILIGIGGNNGGNWPESFGEDLGELEAIQQSGLYVIGGINVPYTQDASPQSVASILALVDNLGAQNNLIGYNAGDEPLCGGGNGSPTPAQVPGVVSGIEGYDQTRPVWFNETAWMTENPSWIQPSPYCYQQLQAALQATNGAASFDYYPLTRPWSGPSTTNFNTVANDTLWQQGIQMQGLAHYAAPGQRLWAYVEGGGDNLGFSEQNNRFAASVTSGSNILVSAGPQQFGTTWVGLAVSGAGIPAGATLQSVISATQAQMSVAATASGSDEPVSVGAGALADCVPAENICVVNGNEYRPAPAQVVAEIWNSIINGATGIEVFCHDSSSESFCLGDSEQAGPAATTAFNTLKYIDGWVLSFAKVLTDTTSAQCSMDSFDFATQVITTASSCSSPITVPSSGTFYLSSSNAAVPAAALVKFHDDEAYIVAQTTRNSAGSGGTTLTFTYPWGANRTATIAYDSNNNFDKAHSIYEETYPVNESGTFSIPLGAYDNYESVVILVK